jgi:hypothetical protein
MSFIKYLGLLLVSFGFIISWYVFSTSYGSFTILVSHFIGVSNVIGVFNPEDKFRSILTPKVYFQIKLLSLSPVILGAFIFKFSEKLDQYAKKIFSTLYTTWNGVKLIEKKYLLIACMIILASLITRLYYAFQPINYDEAWTYIYFTSRGLLTSIAYYPRETPNNHVLNSALTSLTYYLPFSQTINLRLPSIVVGTISLFAFYLTFRKFFKERVALWLMSIFGFLNPVLHYGYKARGYALVILSFIICFYAAVQIVKSEVDDDAKRYWVCLSLGTVMGLYALPSYVYPYFALTTFIAFTLLYRRNMKQLTILFVSLFLTGAITALMYTPIFVVSGFSAVANNKYVSPIPRDKVLESLYGHFLETFRQLFYSEWVVLLVIFLSIFLLLRARSCIESKLAIYVIGISPLILLMHSVIAYPRTWVYLVIPVLFLLGCFLEHLSAEKYGKLLAGSAVLFVVIFIFQYNTFINKYEQFSYEANKLLSFMINKKASKIYVNHDLIKTNLTYLLEEKQKYIEIIQSKQDPLKDNIIVKSDFDFLVLGEHVNGISGYKLIKKLCRPCNIKSHIYVYARG